jgi:hypothetical protein
MHAYETKSDEDSMEALAKKLTDDLRKNIRALVRKNVYLWVQMIS